MVDHIQIAPRTRMTSAEFLALPESNLPMELLNGEIIMVPAPSISHQLVTGNAFLILHTLKPDGVVMFAPTDVYFDDENTVQPDVLWCSAQNTHCIRVEDHYWQGAPDLIVEVLSPGTGRQDKNAKFNLYQKYGVPEYWIADPVHKVLEVWQLQDGRYTRQGAYGPEDTFESAVLGKSVDVSKIFTA